jgi:hypothetical protein
MRFWVRPCDPRAIQPARIWQPSDVLGIGPLIDVPAVGPAQHPMAAGQYWAVVQPPAQQPPVAPPLTAYNAIVNQYGVTPFLSIRVDLLNPALEVPGKVWQPSDLLLIGDALTPPAPT